MAFPSFGFFVSFFFSFFILAFCLALQEQIVKCSLLQGALGAKKKSARSYLKWVEKFGNCYRKTRNSFLFLVSIVWKESKVWVTEQKLNSFEICFLQLLVVKETLG